MLFIKIYEINEVCFIFNKIRGFKINYFNKNEILESQDIHVKMPAIFCFNFNNATYFNVTENYICTWKKKRILFPEILDQFIKIKYICAKFCT